MPRSKTRKSSNGARYFVTDEFPTGKKTKGGKAKTEELEVFSDDCIHICLDYLRRKCSYDGRVYRSQDGELLATKKIVAGASTPETGVS